MGMTDGEFKESLQASAQAARKLEPHLVEVTDGPAEGVLACLLLAMGICKSAPSIGSLAEWVGAVEELGTDFDKWVESKKQQSPVPRPRPTMPEFSQDEWEEHVRGAADFAARALGFARRNSSGPGHAAMGYLLAAKAMLEMLPDYPHFEAFAGFVARAKVEIISAEGGVPARSNADTH